MAGAGGAGYREYITGAHCLRAFGELRGIVCGQDRSSVRRGATVSRLAVSRAILPAQAGITGPGAREYLSCVRSQESVLR